MNPASSSAATIDAVARDGRSVFVLASDGRRLHVREYGSSKLDAFPVVCLPGLTRTTADFDVVAPALANGTPRRRVVALDSRGRGESEYDPNPELYNLAVELADLVTALNALQIGPAIFLGSSRGGVLTMLLAKAKPAAIVGAVLHDIGPVIEPNGVDRIKGYVGKLPQIKSFADGAEVLRQLFHKQFPKLTGEQWLGAAQRTWKVEAGAFVPTYDIRLAQSLAEIDREHPLPPLWDEFDALARVPVLVIRGANSDILSADTITAMRARHPNLDTIEVPDQGHVPLLEAPDLFDRIAAFIHKCDDSAVSA